MAGHDCQYSWGALVTYQDAYDRFVFDGYSDLNLPFSPPGGPSGSWYYAPR